MRSAAFLPFFLLLPLILAGAVPPPAGYTIPGTDTKNTIILSDNFDGGLNGWRNTRSVLFTAEAGAGINGSKGVVFRRVDPKKHAILSRSFKGVPGKQYRASIRFCVEKIKSVSPAVTRPWYHTMYLTCFGTKREYLLERYPRFTVSDSPVGKWHECTVEFTVPKGTDHVEISLGFYSNPDISGVIRYDDFRLEAMGDPEPLIYPEEPKQLRLSSDGAMRFRIKDLTLTPEKNLALRIVTGKKDLRVPVKNTRAEVSGIVLPPGRHKFDLQLLNTAEKKVLGSAEYTFVRLSGKEKPVTGSALFGKDNILRVDGTPFYPIKAAVSPRHLDKAAVDRLRSAGFNTVMPYESLTMDILKRGGAPSIRNIRESLDYCHQHGLKVIFSLKEQIQRGKIEKFEHVRGAEAVSLYAVEKLKDHPAILMWYLSDENPLDEIPAIRSLRQKITLIDPYHPISVCTDRPMNQIYFATAGDLVNPDRYPLYTKESQSMADMRRFFRCDLGHPMIMTVQAFNWKAYHMNDDKDYRFPTEEEMRSMTFLCMNAGTVGMGYYGYTACFRQQEKLWPGSSKTFWPVVSRVVHLTGELGEFILSREPAPAVRVENRSKNFVEAKAFRKGKKVRILVTGDGPGKADAILHVPADLVLKSRFGRCVPVKKGVWHFTGNNVCSDLLTAD